MSNTAQQQIVDDGAPRKYFHIMLNMADDDLDPYEYRLLGHYIRVGQCWESVRTTAEKTRMSVGKVHSTRKALAEKGYISLREHESGTTLVTIIDRWAENVARYAPKIVPDHDDVHTVNVDVHEVNVNVHEVKQRRTIEEEPTKKDSAPDGAPEADASGPAPTVFELRSRAMDALKESTNVTSVVVWFAVDVFGEDVKDYGRAGKEIRRVKDKLGISYRAAAEEIIGCLAAAGEMEPRPANVWDYIHGIVRTRTKDAKPAPREYVPTHVDVYVPPADVVNPVRQKETAA